MPVKSPSHEEKVRYLATSQGLDMEPTDRTYPISPLFGSRAEDSPGWDIVYSVILLVLGVGLAASGAGMIVRAVLGLANKTLAMAVGILFLVPGLYALGRCFGTVASALRKLAVMRRIRAGAPVRLVLDQVGDDSYLGRFVRHRFGNGEER